MEDNERNICDWEAEVEGESSLRWYRLAKDDGTQRYTHSSLQQGYEGVSLMFRLQSGLAGQDKRKCRMCSDGWYVMCDSGEVEDVDHFLIDCKEFGKG